MRKHTWKSSKQPKSNSEKKKKNHFLIFSSLWEKCSLTSDLVRDIQRQNTGLALVSIFHTTFKTPKRVLFTSAMRALWTQGLSTKYRGDSSCPCCSVHFPLLSSLFLYPLSHSGPNYCAHKRKMPRHIGLKLQWYCPCPAWSYVLGSRVFNHRK